MVVVATVTESHGIYVVVSEAASALDMQQTNAEAVRFGQIADTCSSSADERAEFIITTFFAA